MTSRLLQNITKAGVLAGGIAGVSLTYRYEEVKKVQSNLPKTELWSFKNSSTKEDKKNVVIVGGGVVGVTAAYKLATNGHKVVLLEPRSQPGKECSACAAGGMQKSNPVVDRGTWIAVTKSFIPSYIFGDKHEQYKFFHIDWLKSITDPFFLRWSLKFTKTSLFPCSNQEYLQKEMLKFTDYAVDDMIDLMSKKRDPMSKVSGYNPNGSLSLSYDPLPKEESTIKVKNPAAAGKTYEPSRQIIGKDITVHEPSILHQKVQPQSAKHEYMSRAASSERFTEELARRCEEDSNLDVTFLYNTRVEDANTTTSSGEKCRVTQLSTNRGVIDVGDAEVLVAAGAWCPKITAHLGLYCPVYPLKGYAMSISAKQVLASTSLKKTDLPSRIVSDKYMYTSRLGTNYFV